MAKGIDKGNVDVIVQAQRMLNIVPELMEHPEMKWRLTASIMAERCRLPHDAITIEEQHDVAENKRIIRVLVVTKNGNVTLEEGADVFPTPTLLTQLMLLG